MLRIFPSGLTAFCRFFLLIVLCGCGNNEGVQEKVVEKRVFTFSILNQLPLTDSPALPVVYEGDLIIADEEGAVCRFNAEFRSVWSVKLADSEFVNSGSIVGGYLLLSSRDGNVFSLNLETGAVIWKKTLDGSFAHKPLCGVVEGEPVIWLLSQSDGVLFSLKVENGDLLWSSEETNRSDGNAVIWKNKLAYGNCDGSVHLFNAITGSIIGSVPIGDSDQMAGTPLSVESGALWIGTREGRLALIDLESEKLLSTLKISEDEAFVSPIPAFDNMVAMGVSEGRVSLCSAEGGKAVVVSNKVLPGGIDALLYDGALLFVLAEGTLYALNSEMETEALINAGDDVGGVVIFGSALFAVIADRSLLLIKGEWR